MDNPSSPLDTLRQLKEMLDAGALTPSEFEALKQRLVFTTPPATPAPQAAEPQAPAAPTSEAPAPPAMPATPPPVAAPAGPEAAAVPPRTAPEPPAEQFPVVETVPLHSALSNAAPPPPPSAQNGRDTIPPSRPYAATPPPTVPPAFTTPVREPAPLPAAEAGWAADEFPEAEAPPARSPLALILSIGGLLALLALVAYLSLNKHPSEHISSISQTAADSLAAPPVETGPQAAPLAPQSAALPETIRVRPTNPAPLVKRRPVRDSAVVVPPAASAPAATDSATHL